eukprot:TRINITY_DN22490_c0_g1_i1.p1 TRINITY_DN22490_c0_g1~~TRINITY_DN22490_c0_g1_i1.p1  ORF type:complete len:479 (+),score=119.49 TRINITY_DN22490_c0_g1_i1:96-1532(+)
MAEAAEVVATWKHAVEEEDAAAASDCARLCDTIAGAELFAACDGLDAFVMVAMGQSAKSGEGGLMVALAQALMRDMTDFKVAIFETLAAAAQWPSLKGRIAGSGVLGVVVATLLAPRHDSPTRALMARLSGRLGVDAPETRRLGDARREEEFVKLRKQLISSGAVKAFAKMVRTGSNSREAVAAAEAITHFASGGSDAEGRRALCSAGAVQALLSRLPDWQTEDGDEELMASTPPADTTNIFATHLTDEEAAASASEASASGGTRDGTAKVDEEEDGAASSGDEECEDRGLCACLRALAAIGGAEGPGAEELRAPLRRPLTIKCLRNVVAEAAADRSSAEQALRCLVSIGRGEFAWPPAEGDAQLADDMGRLLVCGSEVAAEALCELLADKQRISRCGDLRPLRRALGQSAKGVAGGGRIAASRKALEAIGGCDQCGVAPEANLLTCTGCRKVDYCSRECQKAAWKVHKTACSAKART